MATQFKQGGGEQLSGSAATIHLTPDNGDLVIALGCHDTAVRDFVAEYFALWCRAARRRADCSVTISSAPSQYADMQRSLPASAVLQPCFAHDQEVMSMPAWNAANAIAVYDRERSCFLRIADAKVDLCGDPRTRRWRFTLVWTLLELVATRLRRTHLDLHAAAAQRNGRVVLIAGSKGAGKTTLLLHLLRAHGFSMLANDRAMVGQSPDGAVVLGMPTAIKLRGPTLVRFPELRCGLTRLARPYLYTAAELATVRESEEDPQSVDFALTPNQVATRLGTQTATTGALALVLFPRLCPDEPTWQLEAMTADEVAPAILANLYGAANGARPATVFEEYGGGYCPASPELASRLASSVLAYRLRLGRDAYADASLGERLLQLAAC